MRDKIEIQTEGNPLIPLAGVGLSLAAVIIAVALWQASIGLSIALICAGAGAGGYNLGRGVAHIIIAVGEMRRRTALGQAEGIALIEAEKMKALPVEGRYRGHYNG